MADLLADRPRCALTSREGPHLLRCILHTGHAGLCIADTIERETTSD